ncbi:MAG: PAS domain S-box protein [bacterium]|nr:PAS domain S-box protein [bacterium]
MFVLTSVVLPLDARGQDIEDISFSHIDTRDGLSNLEVLYVFQDSRGFMWFGTKNGLNKYDGMQITPFYREPDNPNSLCGNFAHWILEDQIGNLWIATWGDGISRYDLKTGNFTNYYHEESNPESLVSDFVWSIYVDGKGMVWATTDDGLSRLNPETGSCVNFRHDPQDPNSLSHNTVSRIQEDNLGLFWISTYGGGLVKLDPNTNDFTRYRHNPDDPGSLSNDNLWGVFIDSRNSIWIASEGGLNSFDPDTETFSCYRHDDADPGSLSSDTVTFIYEDYQGILWLGTFGGGVNRFDPASKSFRHYRHNNHDPHSLSNDIVMSITEDEVGTLWVATYGGVDKWDPAENQFVHFHRDPNNPDDMSDAKVRSIYQDADDVLWLGTGDGLHFSSDPHGDYVHYRHDDQDSASISGNDIWAIDQDKRGALWIGTHGAGLNRLDPVRGEFVRYEHDSRDPNTIAGNAVYDLVADRDRDVLWIAVYQSGLDRFDILEETFTHYQYDFNDASKIVSNWATVVCVDSRGSVWVGTENGLSRFDPDTEVFTNYVHARNDQGSLSDNMVYAIFQDSRGSLWVGTSNGLNRFDETTQRFDLFGQRDGLVGNRIAAIAEDDEGLLWISTNRGLSRFNPQDETFRSFDRGDGLQGGAFFMHSVCKNEAGDLYFGGADGLQIIHPAELSTNAHPPRVVFTDFLLFNQSVPVGPDSPLDQHISQCRRISLSHSQSVFRIEFVALNYTNSPKNRYAYKLEGYDGEFTYTDSNDRSATYMNLNPGIYTFKVMASNNDGVWNEVGASVEISIAPPWWRTWWFTSILVCLACLVVGAVFAYLRKLVGEVTRRKQNEKDLRRSRERYRSLFEQAGDYILILEDTADRGLVIIDANKAACKVHGYEHEEFLDLSISDLDQSLSMGDIEALMRRLLTGETVLFDTVHARKDGTVFPVEISSKHLKTETDQKLFVSIERDITKRRAAEERIKQQQHLLERAQELGRIGTWELDLKRNILRWTDENCRIFGVPPGSVVNYEVFIGKVHPEDRDYVDREWKAGVAGKPYDIEHRLLIEGEVTWVREKADVEFDDDGIAVNAIGFTQDITARKQAEEEHANLQEQLIQVQKMESIGRLAGGVAHDFNNMLSVIQGYTEIVLEDLPEDSPITMNLTEVLKASKRSSNLTRQLLAYARKQAIEPQVLDLNDTIKAMFQMLERLIGEDIDLIWRPGENLESVFIDPGQVDQILANLLVNARDAIGHNIGKVIIETGHAAIDEIHCATHPGFEPGDYVMLTVSDDGCGMDKETRGNIFEPFFTSKEVGEGTGLGLATVYGIVKQNGGFINVYSELDLGSTFSVYLPVHQMSGTSVSSGNDDSVSVVGGSETVLLVEDEPAILDLTRMMLDRLGYTVIWAATPAEAILLVEEHAGEIHLLITDVVMPEMNGRDLARKLVTLIPDLSLLYMSGYTADVIACQGVLDEGVLFIQKPFSIQDLAVKVREALSGRYMKT